MEISRYTIEFFSHSWPGIPQLWHIMDKLWVTLGLQTLEHLYCYSYYACSSALWLFNCIAALVHRGLTDAFKLSEFLLNWLLINSPTHESTAQRAYQICSGACTRLEGFRHQASKLEQYVMLLETCAKSIQCLAFSQSTPATVVKSWWVMQAGSKYAYRFAPREGHWCSQC